MVLLLWFLGGALAIGLMIQAGRFLRKSGAMPFVGEAYLLVTGTPRDHPAPLKRLPDE